MTGDELELGLDPIKTKVAPVAEVASTTWSKHTVREPTQRPFCALCMDEVPVVNGVPQHAVTRAVYKEVGPAGTFYLCYQHKEMRQQMLRDQE